MSKAGQRVLSTLRQMIISGELVAGERIAEMPTAERLGVSRTPVRIAFRSLEQEGLLSKQANRGYCVREISAKEVNGAVEVRGVLEGLAARLAAEKGLTTAHRQALIACLVKGDTLFSKGYVTEEDLEIYHDLNKSFHAIVIEASGNPVIEMALSRIEHTPFASVSSLTVNQHNLVGEYHRFNFAHMQHHAAFDALSNGQGARAEGIMREHANATLQYAKLFSTELASLGHVRVIGGE